MLLTLAQNVSPNAMLVISDKNLRQFCCICFVTGILQFSLEDISIFHTYYLKSQFEPWLFKSQAILSSNVKFVVNLTTKTYLVKRDNFMKTKSIDRGIVLRTRVAVAPEFLR